MTFTNSLIKKTSLYLASVNTQNRAPIFFLDQLSKLGLAPASSNIPQDLDFNQNTYLVASLDVRVLSKARLEFLLAVFNSDKVRKAGLIKAKVLSVFSLKGRLQSGSRGLAGFDGSPLLVLTYINFVHALEPLPEFSQADFSNEEEFKEWTSLQQAYLPLYASFNGYIFPFDFFKDRFAQFVSTPDSISPRLTLQAFVPVSEFFQHSLFNLVRLPASSLGCCSIASRNASSVVIRLFSSLISRKLCQQ